MSRLLISDVQRVLNLSDAGVRDLERRGLLTPERVGASRTRVFEESQVHALAGRRASTARDKFFAKCREIDEVLFPITTPTPTPLGTRGREMRDRHQPMGTSLRELLATTEPASIDDDRELVAMRMVDHPQPRRTRRRRTRG